MSICRYCLTARFEAGHCPCEVYISGLILSYDRSNREYGFRLIDLSFRYALNRDAGREVR